AEGEMAMARRGEWESVTRIARARLLEQSQCLDYPLFCYWKERRERAQVEIIGGKVVCRPGRRPADLGRLQCRLDHPGDVQSDLGLELEDGFPWAVQMAPPKIRSRVGRNQTA